MKINWKQKLSSRKFWLALATLVSSVLFLFNVAESTASQITAIITNFGVIMGYLLIEGALDVVRSTQPPTTPPTPPTEEEVKEDVGKPL